LQKSVLFVKKATWLAASCVMALKLDITEENGKQSKYAGMERGGLCSCQCHNSLPCPSRLPVKLRFSPRMAPERTHAIAVISLQPPKHSFAAPGVSSSTKGLQCSLAHDFRAKATHASVERNASQPSLRAAAAPPPQPARHARCGKGSGGNSLACPQRFKHWYSE